MCWGLARIERVLWFVRAVNGAYPADEMRF